MILHRKIRNDYLFSKYFAWEIISDVSIFSMKKKPLNYCKHKGDYSLCVFSQLVYFKEKVSYIYIHRFLLKSKGSHTIFISTEKNCPELKCKLIGLNLWWIPQHYEVGKVTKVNPNCTYVRPPVPLNWMKLITSLGEHFTYFHLFRCWIVPLLFL